jgi:hypothetical protein
MTITVIEGFDNYLNMTDFKSAALWGESSSLNFLTGRFSGFALGIYNSFQAVMVPPSGASATFTVGFAWKGGDGTTVCEALDSANAVQVGLSITNTGIVTAYRGTTANVLGTHTMLGYSNASFYYLEFQATISDASGTIRLDIEGVTSSINATSVDTKASGITSISKILWRHSTNTAGPAIDDLYFDDALTVHGPRRVRTGYTSADSAVTWTPLSSTNESNVDETSLDNDTTYNSTSGVGNQDLFTVETYIGSATLVDAVATRVAFRKDDANAYTAAGVLKSGGTTSVGASPTTPSSYVYQNDIYVTDPNTASAWTTANANAVLIGYKLVS